MTEYEWRVCRMVLGVSHPIYATVPNEYEAELHRRVTRRNYAYEASTYGLDSIWVERREVGPWERAEPRRASEVS